MKRNVYLAAASLLMMSTGFAARDKDFDNQHLDPFVAGSATEAHLIKDVRHALLGLPYYTVFDDIGFNVNGGTVTLVGEVTRPVLKSDAQNAVKHVEGVADVVNNIEVLPLSPNDDTIRRAAYRAIYGDPFLSTRYGFQSLPSIHIIVDRGNIRLEGFVANQADKTMAGLRANGVPGAFKVQNDLQIDGK